MALNVSDLQFWLLLLQIMGVNLILSGDNAVVIALACRKLPPHQQKWGILCGAGAAVGLLIVFTVFVSYLLGIPYLRIVFGGLLFWTAYKLMLPPEAADAIEAAASLLQAVRMIIIADLVMSFDNIVAVAAVAKGNLVLMALGVAISIPMVVGGAALLISLLNRFPMIVPGAAALIGFVGGEIMLADPAWARWVARQGAWVADAVPLASAIVVVLAGRIAARRRPPPDQATVAGEAVEAAAVVGVRAVGQLALTRAPMVAAFVASAFGYGEGLTATGQASAVAGPALDAVRPIFGAVIAIVIAEALAWIARRAGLAARET
jgi:YjbE family integral membrane protein